LGLTNAQQSLKQQQPWSITGILKEIAVVFIITETGEQKKGTCLPETPHLMIFLEGYTMGQPVNVPSNHKATE
jgi:hypothetical protein